MSNLHQILCYKLEKTILKIIKMKKPKTITKPVNVNTKEIYVEESSKCISESRSDEPYGDWSRSYDDRVINISQNKDILNKWNFKTYKVPDIVYEAKNLYLVVVTYSTGNSFGRSDGHVETAFITEDPDEANDAATALWKQTEYNQYSRYPSLYEEELEKLKPTWDNIWKNHPKATHPGYAPWDGYFERVDHVDVVFLSVKG